MMVEMIRRIVRDGPPDQSLKDVNRNSFTSNIQNAMNPLNFKLPTLGMYDGKSNPIDTSNK